MAEILGTVVGIVSLGIQLCSGISIYLESVQCRKEDIESTVRKVESMELILKQIRSNEDRLSVSHSTNGAVLKTLMSNAEAELLLLKEFIGKIHRNDSSSMPKPIRERITEQKQKMLYPFRRDHLDRLNGRLDAANKALQVALEAVQLKISLDSNASVRELSGKFGSMSTGFGEMRLEVQKGFEQSNLLVSMVKEETIALKENIAELLSAILISANATEAVHTLASKPGALKMICDDMKAYQSPEQPDFVPRPDSRQSNNFNSKFQCRCNTKRVLKRKKQRIGLTFLLEETVRENEHDVRCFFAMPNRAIHKKWSAGISFKAFRFLVCAVVNVTMSSTFGAGGLSISPTFTYFHVHDRSPALQVISVLKYAFRSKKWSNKESEDLLERGIGALQASFIRGTSSPFEINRHGQTLLHSASYAFHYSWYRPRNVLLKYLLDVVKVPKDHPDSWGRLPFQTALITSSWAPDYESVCAKAVDFLVSDESILAFETREIEGNILTLNALAHHQAVAEGSLKMAAFYAGHPTEAIFLRREKALLEVLKKTSTVLDLSAVDATGHTVLHHLVGWHDGLKMVLKKFGESVLRLYDNRQTSALQVTLYWSSHLCTSPLPIPCSETCSCADTVKLLLDVDGGCLLRAVSQRLYLAAMCKASAKAQGLVIDELINRRQALKYFAISVLEPSLADRFGLRNTTVLDLHVHNVLEELEKLGKDVPPEHQTKFFVETPSISIYHMLGRLNLNVRHLSNALYSKGFRDIDTRSSEDFTPLTQSYYSQHSAWLIEHGASLDTKMPGDISGYSAAHYLFTRTDRHALETEDIKPTLLEVLRSRVGGDWYLDSCVCACSRNGCHPYTGMWKEYLLWESRGDMTKEALNNMTKRVYEKCTKLEENWIVPRPLKSMSLRVCTFTVLPLCHTCCSHWKKIKDGSYQFTLQPVRASKEDEIEEIHEEDAAEIARLESLLVEFEEKLDQMDCSLAEFFQTYWKSRMEEVLVEIENQSITAEEIESARQLGVVLQVQPAEVVTEEIEDRSNVQYWIQKMDALVK